MQQRLTPRKRPARRFAYSLLGAVVLAAGAGAWLYLDRGRAPNHAEGTLPPIVSRADPMDAAPPLRIPKLIMPEEPAQPGAPVRAYEEAPPEPVYEAARAAAPIEPARPRVYSAPPAGGEMPAWRRNAVALASPPAGPLIAVIIDDAGVDAGRTKQAIALPGPLTISFLPYAHHLASQVAAARAAGHELMVHVSMQPENPRIDPGPHVLRTGAAPAVVLQNLDWALDSFQGYVGINNHMGSRFTADADGMRVVMDELKRRGLLFVDSRTTRATVGEAVARETGIPTAHRNVFLDDEPVLAVVEKQLAQLERVARSYGHAIAIGHPRDATIEALSAWLPTVAAKGFTLAPVSAVVLRMRETDLAGAGR